MNRYKVLSLSPTPQFHLGNKHAAKVSLAHALALPITTSPLSCGLSTGHLLKITKIFSSTIYPTIQLKSSVDYTVVKQLSGLSIYTGKLTWKLKQIQTSNSMQ